MEMMLAKKMATILCLTALTSAAMAGGVTTKYNSVSNGSNGLTLFSSPASKYDTLGSVPDATSRAGDHNAVSAGGQGLATQTPGLVVQHNLGDTGSVNATRLSENLLSQQDSPGKLNVADRGLDVEGGDLDTGTGKLDSASGKLEVKSKISPSDAPSGLSSGTTLENRGTYLH